MQVKLCDPRLSALSVVATIKALYKFTSFLSFPLHHILQRNLTVCTAGKVSFFGANCRIKSAAISTSNRRGGRLTLGRDRLVGFGTAKQPGAEDDLVHDDREAVDVSLRSSGQQSVNARLLRSQQLRRRPQQRWKKNHVKTIKRQLKNVKMRT